MLPDLSLIYERKFSSFLVHVELGKISEITESIRNYLNFIMNHALCPHNDDIYLKYYTSFCDSSFRSVH